MRKFRIGDLVSIDLTDYDRVRSTIDTVALGVIVTKSDGWYEVKILKGNHTSGKLILDKRSWLFKSSALQLVEGLTLFEKIMYGAKK